MNEEKLKQIVKDFFKAVKEQTLLIIIDSASKNEKAVFSLVSFDKKKARQSGYKCYSNMLKELGFKNYGQHEDLFINYCAGRYSLFILDDIGSALRGRGIKLPKDFYNWIQYQNVI